MTSKFSPTGSNANKLSLNVSKSNYVLFSNCNSRITTNQLSLQITGGVIQHTTCMKFLGLHIDQNLTWDEHIKVCQSRLSSARYAINKVRRLVPMHALKNIYYTLVYPHLIYGIVLWGNTFETHLKKLVISQKKIVRSMLGAEYTDHTHPLFLQLNLLKLNDIYHAEAAKIHVQIHQRYFTEILIGNFYLYFRNSQPSH